MSLEECTRILVRAIDRRERDVVMTRQARLGMWVKLVAPAVVDRMALRAVAAAAAARGRNRPQ
jgi:hypothetical protein